MLCVVGCGNLNRSDDGVGVRVAQQLQAGLPTGSEDRVRVFDAGTGGMDVMFLARGADHLVVIDACRSGAEPGAIFQVPGEELARLPEPGYSLHDFRWQHAIGAGRRIFGAEFPDEVTVFLIEAANLDLGLELGAPVAAAADKVSGLVQALIDARLAAGDIGVARGNLYLSRELCEAHLKGVVSVALLVRDGQVLLVPLAGQSAGGLLLKQRNARGDRVVHAQEFFRSQGLAEHEELRHVAVAWCPALAALRLDGLVPGQARPD